MARHLAIMIDTKTVEAILNGQKTVEARLTEGRTVPFGVVKHGDEILVKPSGGLIRGQVNVDNVLYYENLNGEMIGKLRKEYNNDIKVGNDFWEKHGNARFATIIFLKKPKRYLSPVKLEKKDRRPWVVLED